MTVFSSFRSSIVGENRFRLVVIMALAWLAGAMACAGSDGRTFLDLAAKLDDGYRLTETKLIDIGSDGASDHLVHGWRRQDIARQLPGARNFHSSVEVEFTILGPRDLELVFRCRIHATPDPRSNRVTALVNGIEIGRFDVGREFDVYRDEIPGRLLRPGPNRLQFRLEPSARGGVEVSSADGAPPFIVAWDWIRFQGTQSRGASIPAREARPAVRIPFHSAVSFFAPVYRAARLELGPIEAQGTTKTLAGSSLEITAVLADPPKTKTYDIPREEFGRRHRLPLATSSGQFALIRIRAVPGDSPLALDGHLDIDEPRLVAPADALPPASPPDRAVGCPDCNLILVSADTLRADHVGAYGYERETTPNIDRFARDGVLFREAIAQAPNTLPSHASIFTGLLPHQHGAFHAQRQPLPAEALTMAEILQGERFTTGAIASGGQLHPRWQLDQGFELFDTVDPLTRFADIVEQGLDWVDRRGERPFFLFLHTYEVHHPYTPRPEFLELVSSESYEGDLPDEIPTDLLRRINAGEVKIDEADLQHIIDTYDAELLSVDQGFGALIRGLKERGLYDRTLVVLTSDHGEEFGEHGVVGWHSHSLYEELLRIPLIFKLPDSELAGREYEGIARGIDVLPTILEALGVDPELEVTGRSLIGPVQERDPEPVIAVSQRDRKEFENLPQWTLLRTRRWKFMAGRLIDLVEDPREENDVAGQYPGIVEYMERYIASLFLGDSLPRAGQIEVDDDLLEQLRALGYVQ